MLVVTGATGLVGSALMRRLVARRAEGDAFVAKQRVRAVVRPGRDTSCLAGLDVEVVEADMRDLSSLTTAFQDAEAVFHLAGIIDIGKQKLEELRPVNVEGTRNALAACRAAGVRRLVYTSSIHAFVEPPPGVCTDETTPIDPGRSHGSYAKTKAEATKLVLAAAKDGLETVAVYPPAILGPYDFRPSNTGQLILAAVQRRLGAYVDGAYNFVDSRDVADGLIAALEHGRSGEGYLLCGHEVTVLELLRTIEAVSGSPAPRLRLNVRFVRSVSFLIPLYYWATRQPPLFTSYSLDVIKSNCSMSCAKAQSELGFRARPFRDTIEDTVRWFREQGML